MATTTPPKAQQPVQCTTKSGTLTKCTTKSGALSKLSCWQQLHTAQHDSGMLALPRETSFTLDGLGQVTKTHNYCRDY